MYIPIDGLLPFFPSSIKAPRCCRVSDLPRAWRRSPVRISKQPFCFCLPPQHGATWQLLCCVLRYSVHNHILRVQNSCAFMYVGSRQPINDNNFWSCTLRILYILSYIGLVMALAYVEIGGVVRGKLLREPPLSSQYSTTSTSTSMPFMHYIKNSNVSQRSVLLFLIDAVEDEESSWGRNCNFSNIRCAPELGAN